MNRSQNGLVVPKYGAETCKFSLEKQSTYGAVILADKCRLTRLLLVFNLADIARILARNVEELNKQEHWDWSVQKAGKQIVTVITPAKDGDNPLHLEKVSIGRLCPRSDLMKGRDLHWFDLGWHFHCDQSSRFWSINPSPMQFIKKGWLIPFFLG